MHRRYRGDADDFLNVTRLRRPLPATRTLWGFEENPNAHLPPRSCLTKPYRHGVRNSYWMAFAGLEEEEGEGRRGGGEL